MAEEPIPVEVHLERIAREMKTIRELVATAINHVLNAEAEIPERMRRFTNYAHDLHSIKYMYEELGHPAPSYLNRELERIDDRYRQILAELHTDGGTFEKVRREMAADQFNRYDHTRQLINATHKGDPNETGQSDSRRERESQEGANGPLDLGGSR